MKPCRDLQMGLERTWEYVAVVSQCCHDGCSDGGRCQSRWLVKPFYWIIMPRIQNHVRKMIKTIIAVVSVWSHRIWYGSSFASGWPKKNGLGSSPSWPDNVFSWSASSSAEVKSDVGWCESERGVGCIWLLGPKGWWDVGSWPVEIDGLESWGAAVGWPEDLCGIISGTWYARATGSSCLILIEGKFVDSQWQSMENVKRPNWLKTAQNQCKWRRELVCTVYIGSTVLYIQSVATWSNL